MHASWVKQVHLKPGAGRRILSAKCIPLYPCTSPSSYFWACAIKMPNCPPTQHLKVEKLSFLCRLHALHHWA